MPRPDIKPKQSLGQNFLVDANIARKIVQSLDLNADDVVLEIGPGMGVLTRLIQPLVKKVIAVEIDGNLAARLKSEFAATNNCDIIHQDFLKYDLAGLAATNLRIVGNIPYNITSPILFNAMEHREKIRDLTMLVQKEVALRVVSKPGAKEYGILAVQSQAVARVEILMHVPATVFAPRPKVESSLIRWTFTDELAVNIQNGQVFKNIVRQAFGKRRKMLRNSLKDIYDSAPDLTDFTRRPEQLTITEWIELANKVNTVIPEKPEN
ncbi:MAG TPA: 16S rRNA (adenine(1518)-N(6)/adenine(1519)-N(6))-dimethyltransferase RsmA [bacterium]|nr:16S rRNA (adenine(1518)-N(6)/adenine(1519)-N(6))-dimethyltransferase RsmA [bacterium]HPN43801.1 16S rRNA (adenine(1518)-N(6)/adenine(1519)-N(6))-dimethyltransferase RsmA [bacterium]